MRRYTQSEIDLIRNHYPTGGAKAVLRYMPYRTAGSVYREVARLGLRRTEYKSTPRKAPEDVADLKNEFGLTPGELRALRALAALGSRKLIARALNRSVETVNDQISLAYKRMGVNCAAHAVLKAERAGLLRGVEV